MKTISSGYVLLMIMILGAIYLMTYVGSQYKEEPLTEFYILNDKGDAENYPLNLSIREMGSVTVGVINHEFKDFEYLLAVSYDDVAQSRSITLKDSGKWEGGFNFTFNRSGRHRVDFRLYRDGEPYRRLHLWVDVREQR